MHSTMQDVDLLVSDLFLHGLRTHPESSVLHYQGGEVLRLSFREFGSKVTSLAAGLRRLGVSGDDVVATLCWNSPAHLAAYFAVPGMGAVLHTLNLRLHDDQIVYIANHAADKVILVDADLVPQLQRIIDRLPTVEHVIIAGEADLTVPAGVQLHCLDDVLDTETDFRWPRLPERSAAALCYTTGTTGDPKGVAYSHRSIYLHSLQISTGSAFGFSDADRVLPIVPMFHANAWGWPHAAWTSGADIILNDRYLQINHLARIITDLAPTAAAAVPTLWTGLDEYARTNAADLTSLRLAVSGGSPLSAALVRSMATHHGVALTQGWGMTETSPLLTFSRPPRNTPDTDLAQWASLTGRIVPGVQARIVSETGDELPCDGESIGEVQLRGATIAGSYFRTDAPDKFDNGWLRTGDLGVLHDGGWIQLKDRLKDGIKSGGEWISTVELENALLEHDAIIEVAVIGVPDPKWEERPFVCVTLAPGATATAPELLAFLDGKVARWWLPERWAFVDALPKTSVGKLDKKDLRRRYDADELAVNDLRTTRTGDSVLPPSR
ncbi:fatty acid--CoA ligase [Rhodococcus sp. IEGM 248]|uniref:fatty acid--CoA ligase n=1 Tax=Rhodococcus opacus TaxID=37919 RepID=UPI0013C05D2B|nr:fatty acid--CoA ligase [Rhodococcus opacus]MDV7089904.1 fatty acid--CoA ligase [Rhodococcus opacus]NDV10362.1 fatty acid--CoA ligase [Rhodococcus sp. IEGM 248]